METCVFPMAIQHLNNFGTQMQINKLISMSFCRLAVSTNATILQEIISTVQFSYFNRLDVIQN